MATKATISEENFNVRKATLDDYDAVVAIDTNIWDGFDQLPRIYKTFMEDPLRIGFVLEKDGIIVSRIYCLVLYDKAFTSSFVIVRELTQ